jgi:thymidylate kinase
MRSIFVGIEYAGKSTLIDLLGTYYRQRKVRIHGDDHFTIPDSTLSPESRQVMVGLPDDMKERMQRMQIHYHVDIIKKYACPLIAGWHIEEAVYTDFYGDDSESPYYKKFHHAFQRLYEAQVVEAHLPDVVMFHVTASDEEIARRMRENPHDYPIVREKDIAKIKKGFEEEIEKSLFTHQHRTVVLDTTDKTPRESFDELLHLSEPLVTMGELALRAQQVPAGEYEVKYENGVRKMVPL